MLGRKVDAYCVDQACHEFHYCRNVSVRQRGPGVQHILVQATLALQFLCHGQIKAPGSQVMCGLRGLAIFRVIADGKGSMQVVMAMMTEIAKYSKIIFTCSTFLVSRFAQMSWQFGTSLSSHAHSVFSAQSH